MKIKLVECPICGGTEWRNLDDLRDRDYWYQQDFLYDDPVGFKGCEKCAFITYDYETDEELQRRYEDQRPVINANGVITANRKRLYHRQWLVKDGIWDYTKMPSQRCLDVGAGIGYFVDELTEHGHKACGLEINDNLRVWGQEEYGIEMHREFPDEKFDMISCYHVLEHCQHPDKKLMEIRDHLKDDGYLYLAIPTWFDKVFDEPAGLQCNDWENLYHLNHVNVFSVESANNLLAKCGLEKVAVNNEYYGRTMLLKKSEPKELTFTDNLNTIIERMKAEQEAVNLFKTEKYKEASELMPGYADAWVLRSMKEFKDFEHQKNVLIEGMEATDGYYKVKRQLAALLLRWNENMKGEKKITNNIRESKRMFEELLIQKAGMEDHYDSLAMIEANYYCNYERATELLKTIQWINPGNFSKIVNLFGWMYKKKNDEKS